MEDKDERVFEAPPSEKNLEGESDAKNSDQSFFPEAQSTTQPSATAEIEAAAPGRSLKGIAWIICVASILSSVFLYALDNTIIATIQPAIIGDLSHLEKLPWLSVAFQLTSFTLDLTWYVHVHVLTMQDFGLPVLSLAGESFTPSSTASLCSSHPFSTSKSALPSAVLYLPSTR